MADVDAASRRTMVEVEAAHKQNGLQPQGTAGPHPSASKSAATRGLNVTSHVTSHTVSNAHGFKVRSWCGGDERFWWGLASAQGRRLNMEDAHTVDLRLDEQRTAMFGVFDGHAGKEVAAYCANHMRDAVLSSPSYGAGNLESGLAEAFLILEASMGQPAAKHELYCLRKDIKPDALASQPDTAAAADGYGLRDEVSGEYLGPRAGATTCVALVRGDRVSVAHVGDSRCVLCDNGTAVALTRDHKAKDPEEARRVVKAGLTIERNRVRAKDSSLAMTRTLGDTKYKQPHLPPAQQAVTPVPETTSAPLDMLGGGAAGTPAAEQLGVADFLVLACDGLWDIMSNQQAVTYLHVAMDKGLSPQQAALALVEEVLAPASSTPPTRDNVTIMVVQFAPMPEVAA